MLDTKKDELRREIARRERELEKLEGLPDLAALTDGTVAGMAVRLGASQPYTYVGLKTGGRWYLTGKTGPNGVTSDKLAEWLTTGGRELVAFLELAEIETTVEVVGVIEVESAADAMDLAAALDLAMARAQNPFRGTGRQMHRGHYLLDDSNGYEG